MKNLFVLSICMLAFSVAAMAQPQMNMQRRTPAERAAVIHAKLDSAFKLEPTKLAMVDTALTVLYKRQEARMREIMESGDRPDPESMREEFKKYSDAQEEILKAVLTADQFTIWKDQILPSMRRGGPGGGGGGFRMQQGGGGNQ
jgi:hypothetical protein